MKFENLSYTEKDRTAWITLNRPEVYNALSMKLSDELVQAIEMVRQSTELKFVVIKGAGDNFCVGDTLNKWDSSLRSRMTGPMRLPRAAPSQRQSPSL